MAYNNLEIKQRSKRAYIAVEKYGKTLWHYTDFVALNGILNEKEIWFGSTVNMNDKEEVSGFICDLKKEVFLQISCENKEKANTVFDKIEKRMRLEYPFAFCVSRARNDAAQWERYADNGHGVAIVFNTEKIFSLIFYNHFIMNEEYYGYNAKQHEIKKLLVDYIQNGKMDAFSDLDGLIDNLLLCALIHKHESFAPEQEVRICPYFVKDNDSHLQYKIGNTIKKVYVLKLKELCREENIEFEDLIEAVVIGPKSQQNIEDFKWYCKKIGLLKIADRIFKSDCPLK